MSDPSKHRQQRAIHLDDVFQRLPALGSAAYTELVRTAPPSDLPPEVLARAYRQLPRDHPASVVTLNRLVRRVGRGWEYIQPLVYLAGKRALQQAERSPGDEAQDLLQDALLQILAVLPTPRGGFAEGSWHAFCRREFSTAWRQRYGDKGHLLRPQRVRTGTTNASDEGTDPLDSVAAPSWSELGSDGQSERIEAITQRVADELPDAFTRAVAKASWFNNRRPKVSGQPHDDRPPPLTSQFPGKRREQIHQALREADSTLAAALLDDPQLRWSDALRQKLETQRDRSVPSTRTPETEL